MEEIKEVSKDGSKVKGAMARAAKLSPERRKEIASMGASARWRSSPLKASHVGILTIGNLKLDVANLPDGRRVVSEAAIMRALGRGYSGHYSQRDASAEVEGSAVLPRYMAPLALKPFIPNDLLDLLSEPIAYLPPDSAPGSKVMYKGIEDRALPKICRVWMAASKAGKLNSAQERAATQAEILAFGFAEVGIAALIDEATGYQAVRDKIALQAILDQFLRKEFAAWAKRFPDEFYQQIFRLRGWKWRGMKVNRPQVVAKYTNDFVWSRLAPGLLSELQRRNPPNEKGRRQGTNAQLLTDDIGIPALSQHLHTVVAFMRVSETWAQFTKMLNLALPPRGEKLQLELFNDPSTIE